jgi:hypothetical protein
MTSKTPALVLPAQTDSKEHRENNRCDMATETMRTRNGQ